MDSKLTGKDMQSYLGATNPAVPNSKPMTALALVEEIAIVKTAEQMAFERGRCAALTAPDILWELEVKSGGVKAVVALLGLERAKDLYVQGVKAVRGEERSKAPRLPRCRD